MNNPNSAQLENLAEILIALTNGEEIQERAYGQTFWYEKSDFDIWRIGKFEYRIKPEPREVWVNLCGRGFGAYSTEAIAYEHINSDIKYDDIAVHFKEVIDDGLN